MLTFSENLRKRHYIILIHYSVVRIFVKISAIVSVHINITIVAKTLLFIVELLVNKEWFCDVLDMKEMYEYPARRSFERRIRNT